MCKKIILYLKRKWTYIAKACKNSWNTLTGTINPGNEIHPRADPVEWPYNGELKTILGTLGCKEDNNEESVTQFNIITKLAKRKCAHHRWASQSTVLHMHKTTSAYQLSQKCKGKYLLSEYNKQGPANGLNPNDKKLKTK